MKLILLKESLGIYRLNPEASIPDAIWSANFLTISKTPSELSIVVSEDISIDTEDSSLDWFGFYVEGPLPHDMVGVIAQLTKVLAEAKCSVFTIATYDTDYILVQNSVRKVALSALENAGYKIFL